jgi:hypothetical protein
MGLTCGVVLPCSPPGIGSAAPFERITNSSAFKRVLAIL